VRQIALTDARAVLGWDAARASKRASAPSLYGEFSTDPDGRQLMGASGDCVGVNDV
jgi:hypothetical protein